jgi:hypothetical protein
MPSVIANIHDDKLKRFLSNKEKSNMVVEITSYLRKKSGSIVPVQIRSIPHIDIKHDLRFISLLRTRESIVIDDTEITYSNCFVFLIDEYGRIDSTSDSCQRVLNID